MNKNEKLKGNIAATESEIAQLQANHDRMVQQFNQQVQSNQSRFHQLVGRLNTLREMLPKEDGENGRDKSDVVKTRAKRCSPLPNIR